MPWTNANTIGGSGLTSERQAELDEFSQTSMQDVIRRKKSADDHAEDVRKKLKALLKEQQQDRGA